MNLYPINSVNYFLEPITYCSYVYKIANETYWSENYTDDNIIYSPRPVYTTEPRFIMMLHPNYFNEEVIYFFDKHSKFATKWFNENKYDFFYYVFERDINGDNIGLVNSKQSFIDLCKKAFDMKLFKQGREKIVMEYISKAENYDPDIYYSDN